MSPDPGFAKLSELGPVVKHRYCGGQPDTPLMHAVRHVYNSGTMDKKDGCVLQHGVRDVEALVRSIPEGLVDCQNPPTPEGLVDCQNPPSAHAT
jgi:hypothetical protein